MKLSTIADVENDLRLHNIRDITKIYNINNKGSVGAVAFVLYKGILATLKIWDSSIEDSREKDLNKYFSQECENAQKFRHPCLMQFIDKIQDRNNGRYIIYYHVPGCSLDDYIIKMQRHYLFGIDSTQILIILYGIAHAMAYMHEVLRITHRDLKPENILLNQDLEPVVSDYNFSKATTTPSLGAKSNAGTRGYIPPEIYKSGPNLPNDYSYIYSDSYAFGIVMYELLLTVKNSISAVSECPTGKYERAKSYSCQYSLDFPPNNPFNELLRRCTTDEWKSRISFSEILDNLIRIARTNRSLFNINNRFDDYVAKLGKVSDYMPGKKSPFIPLTFNWDYEKDLQKAAFEHQMKDAIEIYIAIHEEKAFFFHAILQELDQVVDETY